MDLLLDTHLLLWSAYRSPRLSVRGRALIEDAANRSIFSTASLWEVTIKRAQGRPEFQVDPRELRTDLLLAGFTELEITSEHVMSVGSLPSIHGDPFDRLLIAQASVESCLLLTSDRKISQYPGRIEKV